MREIKIESGSLTIVLEVAALNNPTTRKIGASLPIESKAARWGEEIYFDTGISASSQGATLDVEVGDIAYWPEGKSLCIFFGKTPASIGDKPMPASEVVVIGKAKVDPAILRKVKSGAKIIVK